MCFGVTWSFFSATARPRVAVSPVLANAVSADHLEVTGRRKRTRSAITEDIVVHLAVIDMIALRTSLAHTMHVYGLLLLNGLRHFSTSRGRWLCGGTCRTAEKQHDERLNGTAPNSRCGLQGPCGPDTSDFYAG